MLIAGTRLMSGPLPPVVGVGENHSPIATTANRRYLPLQVINDEGQKLQAQKSFSVSRRDAMIFLAAPTLSAVTFWSVEPAEARISRSEIKRKILEKLEQIREKAGISKLKDKNEKNLAPEPPTGKDENLQTSKTSINSPKNTPGSLMEVIIP